MAFSFITSPFAADQFLGLCITLANMSPALDKGSGTGDARWQYEEARISKHPGLSKGSSAAVLHMQ